MKCFDSVEPVKEGRMFKRDFGTCDTLSTFDVFGHVIIIRYLEQYYKRTKIII